MIKIRLISTFFGWIASIFLIAFSIVLAFNPQQILNFLDIKFIPYSTVLGLILLVTGVVAYVFHFLAELGEIKRRLLWVPAVIIFYGLSFYSSTQVVNSLASYMFFSLASLYVILMVLNNYDLEFLGKPLNVGVFLVNIAAFFFALIIFLQPEKYVYLPDRFMIIGQIDAFLLLMASAAAALTLLFAKKNHDWIVITSGCLLTILFILIALNPLRSQAVIPFFVWLGMFYRPTLSYSAVFYRKTGSIKRVILSYSALIIIAPLLLASFLISKVSYQHHLEMSRNNVNNLSTMASLYLNDHLESHLHSAQDSVDLLGHSFNEQTFNELVRKEDSDHVLGAAVIDSTGKAIFVDGVIDTSRFDEHVIYNNEPTFFADSGMNVLIPFTANGERYYLNESLNLDEQLSNNFKDLSGSELKIFAFDRDYRLVYGKIDDLSGISKEDTKALLDGSVVMAENSLAIFKNVEIKSGSGLRVLFASEKKNIEIETGLLNRIILYILLVTFGLGLLLSLTLSKSILEPIQSLTKAINIKKMKINLDILNRYIPRKDEIGSLARSFYELYYRVFDTMRNLNVEEKKAEALYKEESEWSGVLKLEVEKMEAIFAGIGDGIFVLNKKGEIEKFNQTALDLTSKTAENLLGKNIAEVFTFTDRKTNKTVSVFDINGKRKTLTGLNLDLGDGAKLRLPISFITTTIHDIKNKPAGAVFVFHDYTEECELDEAKSEFVSVAAHQLRTPLTAMKLATEMLEEQFGKKANESQKNIMDILMGANERLLMLVNDLLNVSRIDAKQVVLNLEDFSFSDMISEITNELQVKATSKNQDFQVKLDKVSVHADRRQLREAFQNLIENAIKYTPDLGVVSVTIKDNKGRVEFSVSDSGIGISPTEQKSLFRKFYRTDSAQAFQGEGTGLGLYIAKHAIEAAGGKIEVISDTGKGTTFKVSLPSLGK